MGSRDPETARPGDRPAAGAGFRQAAPAGRCGLRPVDRQDPAADLHRRAAGRARQGRRRRCPCGGIRFGGRPGVRAPVAGHRVHPRRSQQRRHRRRHRRRDPGAAHTRAATPTRSPRWPSRCCSRPPVTCCPPTPMSGPARCFATAPSPTNGSAPDEIAGRTAGPGRPRRRRPGAAVAAGRAGRVGHRPRPVQRRGPPQPRRAAGGGRHRLAARAGHRRHRRDDRRRAVRGHARRRGVPQHRPRPAARHRRARRRAAERQGRRRGPGPFRGGMAARRPSADRPAQRGPDATHRRGHVEH